MFQAQYQSLKACSHRPGESYIPLQQPGNSQVREKPPLLAVGMMGRGESNSRPRQHDCAQKQQFFILLWLKTPYFQPFYDKNGAQQHRGIAVA